MTKTLKCQTLSNGASIAGALDNLTCLVIHVSAAADGRSDFARWCGAVVHVPLLCCCSASVYMCPHRIRPAAGARFAFWRHVPRALCALIDLRMLTCNIPCSKTAAKLLRGRDSATRGTRFRHARNARFRHAKFRVPPQSWNDRNARFRMFRVVCSTVAELVFRHGGMRRKTSSVN